MKKLLFVIIAVFGFSNISAQGGEDNSQNSNSGEGFNLGLHVGIPVGDWDDLSSFTLGLDVSYLFNLGEGLDVGLATGYINFFSKDFDGFEVEDLGVIPVALSSRIVLGEDWFFGADVGYGIITNEGSDGGGFYYYPKIGLRIGSADIFGYYQSMIKDSIDASSVGIGATFNLN
ncbi:hypothetical protein [Aestuariivivens sediminicola]|uniref:hypothetical protein n=1 Tax=Aestuariivivens sediminicola TaxID=2913560 RepID=UPI001F5A4DD0|nr:hypothetical protein [Aestuariivivens sediminicola]